MRKVISRLQLLRDQLRRKVGIWLFDKSKAKIASNHQQWQSDQIKHIVFVRTDAKLGDAFVSSFVFSAIKKFNRDIQITVVASPNMASLFTDHLGADRVVMLEKRPKYSDIRKACQEIGQCDLVVSLSLNMKMKDIYFLRCCQASHVAGLDDELKLIDLKLGSATKGKHFSEKFMYLLDKIGIKPVATHYVIPQTKESRQTAQNFIHDHQLNRYCVINAFGSGNARKLTGESIKKICQSISRHDPDIKVVLVSSPETKLLADQYIKQFDIDALHYNVSRSIFDISSFINFAEFVVSVDTATVHMTTGLSRPQLAFYHDDKENFSQWHPNSDLALTSIAKSVSVPDINSLDWEDVDSKIAHLVAKAKDPTQ